MIKPRISRLFNPFQHRWRWVCTDNEAVGFGDTPAEAYLKWYADGVATRCRVGLSLDRDFSGPIPPAPPVDTTS